MGKRQVLFIQGAGNQREPEGSGALAAYLQQALGSDYDVLSPDMPDPDEPRYEAWKARIEKQLDALDDEPLLIGHSLGGSVLLKCLALGKHRRRVAGLFLVAAPYWGKDEDWQLEWALPDDVVSRLPQISRMFLYLSRNDPHVPFAHLGQYRDKLPWATARALAGQEHSFTGGLPELVEDIRSL